MATTKLINIVLLSIIVTALSSTVMLVITKYDLFNRYELTRKPMWPKVCYLCFGFWLSYFIAIVLDIVLTLNLSALHLAVVALCCASLVRKLTSDITL